MRKRNTRLVARAATAMAMLTIAFAADIAAQMPTGLPAQPIRIGFGGGFSVPTSDARKAFENGINGQAYLLVSSGFLPPFRINLGYEKFDLKDAILGGATGESTILSGVAALSFNLFQLGPVRPYVVAGFGAFNIKDVLESAGGEAETSSTHFGIDGGAGLALRIGPIEGFIEGRVQNVYTEAGVVDAKNIRAIPVTFGILF
jgi:hypothetical protein